MSEKLLPCPFCGGEAEIIPWWQNRERYHVRCKTAECNYTHNNRADAAAAWNRRAAPSADDEQETAPHAAPQSEGVNTTEPNLDLIASVEADLQEIVSARRTIEQAQHCDNYTDAARALDYLVLATTHILAITHIEAALPQILSLARDGVRARKLERERDEALQLAEGPSTLKDLAAMVFERGVQLDKARAIIDDTHNVLSEVVSPTTGEDGDGPDLPLRLDEMAEGAVNQFAAAQARIKTLEKNLYQAHADLGSGCFPDCSCEFCVAYEAAQARIKELEEKP